MKSGIYEITNTISGKVYIGSAVNIEKRIVNHLSALKQGNHHNPHLQCSWNKHGPGAFKFECIFKCCEALLIWHEQRAIDMYHKEIGWEMMYNIAPKARSLLGIKWTPETRKKMSEAKKGKKYTPEARANMSAAAKGNTKRKGYRHTPETREKMSKAKKGRTFSPEHRANLSKAAKNRQTPKGGN